MKKDEFERIAYVFQGGGALGSYQVGAFQALEEAGYQPDWVAGISIGSINAAIIAGNAPNKRLEKLTEFWNSIATPDLVFMPEAEFSFPGLTNMLGAQAALTIGQPGFFMPRAINPWFQAHGTPDTLSFYDTSPLRQTLENLIDFDRINAKEMQLSLGAVNVHRGDSIFFRNLTHKIGPEHIMASAALPPGFPAVMVDGELYWDGGVLSNSPLIEIIDSLPRRNTLCFMIDLFGSIGQLPQTLDQVLGRQKDISYASHSVRIAKIATERQSLRKKIAYLLEKLPEAARNDPEVKEIAQHACTRVVHVAHVVYCPTGLEYSSKDYNFSKAIIQSRISAGYEDTLAILNEKPWEKCTNDQVGAFLHQTPHNRRFQESNV